MEMDMFNEFQEICHRERKSIASKLNELVVHAVETNGIGENNPLGITYGPAIQQRIANFNIENPREILDWFIDNRIIGVKQWQPAFAEVQDQEQMQRYVNLTDIMYTTAKNRMRYLRTGRAVVSTGKVQTLPTMKGTRSGF
jgi:hypothetical protein